MGRLVRGALIGLAMIGAAGAARAEEFGCRSFDAEIPLSLDFAMSTDGREIALARFQIEDDIGYATDATEPSSVATITQAEFAGERFDFNFHYRDAHYDGDVAMVRLVRQWEGAHPAMAGVVRVVGGGVWPVSCRAR